MGESIKDTILAKFQQLSKEKEELSRNVEKEKCETVVQEKKPGFKGKYNNRNHFSDRGNKRRFNSPKTYRGPTTSLPESAVGITEYVTPSVGFSGIIKHRFSDFQVHEIDKTGKVIILDSTDLPVTITDDSTDHKSALTEEQWSDLEKIMASNDKSTLSIEVTELDKAQRTAIHKAVKAAYGAKVCSNSAKEEEKTFIKIGRATKTGRDRVSWPENQGRFLHFTVFKENLDTSTLINVLSKCLRTKNNTISFAGTKDKRAKTTQRMCVKNRQAELLKKVNCYKAHFGNFSYEHNPLRLGDLSGNKFTIAIRNVTISDDVIGDILKHVQSVGFINYFGLQRFGSSPTMPTHWVGKLLLLEDWREAVNAILTPKDGIMSDIQDACEVWAKTKNASLAFSKIERRNNTSIEAKILEALKKLGNNFYDALFALPRNSLLLYLHAYQSYVWNKVMSRRIKEFGLKPIAGDLVYVEQTEAIDDIQKEADVGMTEDAKEEDENSEDESDDNAEANGTKKSWNVKAVKKLTEEEATNTPLSEIVYPLPGNDVEFPANVTEKWYFEVMEEDGITIDNFTNSKKVFSMYGTYRKVLTQVQDLEWKIVKYNSTNDDLIQSDWDKLQGRSLPPTENESDATYKGIIMDFSLKSSSYATMLLREVMKCDTSSCYHANLTQNTHSNGSNNDEPPEKQMKTNNEGD